MAQRPVAFRVELCMKVRVGFIEQFITKLGERFNIREIAFDRWGAVQMVQNLEGMGEEAAAWFHVRAGRNPR